MAWSNDYPSLGLEMTKEQFFNAFEMDPAFTIRDSLDFQTNNEPKSFCITNVKDGQGRSLGLTPFMPFVIPVVNYAEADLVNPNIIQYNSPYYISVGSAATAEYGVTLLVKKDADENTPYPAVLIRSVVTPTDTFQDGLDHRWFKGSSFLNDFHVSSSDIIYDKCYVFNIVFTIGGPTGGSNVTYEDGQYAFEIGALAAFKTAAGDYYYSAPAIVQGLNRPISVVYPDFHSYSLNMTNNIGNFIFLDDIQDYPDWNLTCSCANAPEVTLNEIRITLNGGEPPQPTPTDLEERVTTLESKVASLERTTERLEAEIRTIRLGGDYIVI